MADAPHSFDRAINLTSVDVAPGRARYDGEITADYQNKIGPFGGVGAALLAQGMQQSVGEGPELISITADFLTGMTEDPIEVSAICHRVGKSTEFWAASIKQGDAPSPALRATGVFSKRRDTLEWTEGEMPDAPPPQDCERFQPPRTWGERIEIRPALNTDFFNSDSTRNALWVRFAKDRPLDPIGLVCLADTPTPRVFFTAKRFVPLSTVSMSVYLHASAEDYSNVGADYVFIDAYAGRGGGGFYDQHARIWSRSGKLLATTQQMVWYKAEK
ncbi:acyl-CoA thioesterase [Hyphobacterium sp.]|uniref:acyl-CoA thioesterase n=1 Tax=Hyphobacterium sp. TaxID=2004662 RepID=UPI003BAB6262